MARPLFAGDAGSGESEIRRWIIENDWLEAIVALPDQLFYNTGICTYVWIVTNRKAKDRRGKVQLINGVQFFRKMRKSLNNKRNEIAPRPDRRPDAHLWRLPARGDSELHHRKQWRIQGCEQGVRQRRLRVPTDHS